MATLDDKLLGEKLHYYCSSSEEEGGAGDSDDEGAPGPAAGPSAELPAAETWSGVSTNVSFPFSTIGGTLGLGVADTAAVSSYPVLSPAPCYFSYTACCVVPYTSYPLPTTMVAKVT